MPGNGEHVSLNDAEVEGELTSWREPYNRIRPDNVVRPVSVLLHREHEVLLRVVEIISVIVIPRVLLTAWLLHGAQMRSVVLGFLSKYRRASYSMTKLTFPPVWRHTL